MHLAVAADVPELVRVVNAAYLVEQFFVAGDRTDAATVERLMQGAGLGRRLVDAAEQYVRDGGGRAMDIRVVNLRTELLPFYERLGYVEIGTEAVDEPRALRPFHFIVMSKEL